MDSLEKDFEVLKTWAKDVFLFGREALNMQPAEPVDELRGVPIAYQDAYGVTRTTKLFDADGNLIYHDLNFYKSHMFKNQTREAFKKYNGTCFTWQQTVKLEAYNRALGTFGKDSYDATKRRISSRSGHGVGKTATTAVIAIHFLLCFFGAQVGMTANTEQQINDIFMKEFYKWKSKLPKTYSDMIVQTGDHIKIGEDKDWFLRAQVARPEKPEALAGLHGAFVLLLLDEASGIADTVISTMEGSLTGEDWVVIEDSNPTRTEGAFFDHQKQGSLYSKLHFNSEDSPIVKESWLKDQENKEPGGKQSDHYRIRVRGEFASTNEMNDKGYMPLFANATILFEPEVGQIMHHALIGVDPAGSGKDKTMITLRDNVYMKLALEESTSNPKDGARKVETIRDAYQCSSNDIGIDAFGEGAKWVGEIQTKMGENVAALLTDKPRPGTEHEFVTFKDELAWKFRTWVMNGGIIITNNQKKWVDVLGKIKYKRVRPGRIQLQPKIDFKKEYGFSPDLFDAAIYTFFKDQPSQKVVLNKNDLERQEMEAWKMKANQPTSITIDTDMSSM